MKNRNVGFLMVGIAAILGLVVFLFNNALTKIVSTSCSHGPSCPMYGTIKTQTYIALALIAIIVIVGLILILSKEEKKIIIKRIGPYKKLEAKKFDKKSLKGLSKDEIKVMNLLLENEGSIFQSELVEKSGFNKVKITRILDKLEGKQLIERRRRGMTNIIILKQGS